MTYPLTIQKHFVLSIIIQAFTLSCTSSKNGIQIDWSIPTHLPSNDSSQRNPGLAGVFAGFQGNFLIIAGGANFPNSMPWQGGEKVYSNDIYVLQINGDEDFFWINNDEFKLNQGTAYGASLSVDEGIVCIGGENENGILQDVFLIHWDSTAKKIFIKDLPKLPIPLTNTKAVVIGKIIYVMGGESTNGASAGLYFLNLNNIEAGWSELEHIPEKISNMVLVVQSNGQYPCIYLIGGRKKNANGISDFFSDVYEFDPHKSKWTVKKPLPSPLSAGTGISIGKNHILIFGGDKGEAFHQTELLISAIAEEKDEAKKEDLIKKKNQLQRQHPGFSNEILMYDTIKDVWIKIGFIPFNTPVTTSALLLDDCVLIPSGEIKAGVRTPQILKGKIILDKK